MLLGMIPFAIPAIPLTLLIPYIYPETDESHSAAPIEEGQSKNI